MQRPLRTLLLVSLAGAGAVLASCQDLAAPTPSSPVVPSSARRWLASQGYDHSAEDDYACGGFLGDGSNSCTGLVVTSSTTSGAPPAATMTTRSDFSQPVEKVDYLLEIPVHASVCTDDRGIDAPCYYIDFPALTGTAYDAAGKVVATDSYGGGGRTYVRATATEYTSMALYSQSNDIVRVEFSTSSAAGWTLGYARFGAAPAITCTQADATRGGSVDCVTSGYAVVGTWNFSPTDAAVPTVSFTANSAGSHWSGPVVANGTITVDGWVKASDFPDPARKVAAARPATVAVTPRSWSTATLQLPGLPTLAGAGSLEPFPRGVTDAGGTSWTMTWGLYSAKSLERSSLQTLTVGDGPNKGYLVLAALPALERTEVFLNPALDGTGAWAQRQTGVYQGLRIHPQLKIPFCTKAAFAPLKVEAARHEGLTGASASHFGIWQDVFAHSGLPARWEALVAVSVRGLVTPLFASYQDVLNDPAARARHDQLDKDDGIDAIRRWSGNCEFIYQP